MKSQQKVDEKSIWKQFQKEPSDKNRNQLMEYYAPLVRRTAKRLRSKLPNKIELDELVSAGNLGLMKAVEGFDPARDVKFDTYATPRITGSILDDLRNKDWVPRLVRARARQLSTAVKSFKKRMGREPTEEEIAQALGLDTHQFEAINNDAHAASLFSLNGVNSGNDEDNCVSQIELIENDKSQDPFREAQRRDLKRLLTKSLTPAEELIVVLYYYERMTMKEIGLTLDLSESRVSQMHRSIMERLKAHLDKRDKEFMV